MSAEPPPTGPVPRKPENAPPIDVFSETVIGANRLGAEPAPDSKRMGDLSTNRDVGASATATSPQPSAVQPQVLGRYEVRRTLGTGGFGTVYLGHDAQLDRAVAIKVLRARSAPSTTMNEQFLQEARKLAQLRHPGIVTVHDVGIHEGSVYVVSDYLDGPDLGRWLADNRLSWPEATRIVAAVADALAHAHARLIVHRDVKPANIIIVASDRSPVLVDFGLALDETSAGGREKGMVSGTPWYMSPEQAAGTAHRIDGRIDIYSLGVVLYEMLTGRVPFRANDFADLMRQIRDDEPQPPRQLIPDIPPDLERACLKALAKRQQDRYATAGDFAEDLRLVLAAASMSGFPHSPPPIQSPIAESQRAMAGSFSSSVSSLSSSLRRAREAERRQVTMVACGCDLFESDAYLELDAEDQVDVLRAFRQACEESLCEFDGTVVSCNEEGLLACFGYPVAYEDGAQRAARVSLKIAERMRDLAKRLQREHALELDPWIAIHTGSAIAETKDDAISLVGEARNVALRLGEVAIAGQVICTDTAHRLFHDRFRCESLGGRKIKGVSQPVELFRVLGALTDIDAATARPAAHSPLTGRDHEVSLLQDRWEQAQEGMGQVVLLIGEPGLGKSRLVETLKEHVQRTLAKRTTRATPEGSPVIEWRCSSRFQNTCLHPAREFFEHRLGFGADETPAARFECLVEHLRKYGLDEPDVVPLFASLLSLPLDGRFRPLGLAPIREREELFRALGDWLRAYAQNQPVLFIVEDLHWVDPSTIEFLTQFVAVASNDSILTLLTFRPEFKTPWPVAAHQTSLALNRLTRRQVGELLRKSDGESVSEGLIDRICDRTGGVPLFVEEFARLARESGLMQGNEPGTEGGFGREIPATLQELVMARVDRIEGERELAQLAAALGREFSYELLASLADLDEPTLQQKLASLTQAEILYPKGRPPRCTYAFKHALFEDALYGSLVKSKRQQFHLRIGAVLESRFPQVVETHPELLGYHFTEGGESGKAIAYWLKAGLRSREQSADQEAISHLTKGLALLATLEESAERDADELRCLTALGPAYIAVRGYAAPEVGPTLLRARELCQRIGEPRQLFGIMLGIWEWRVVRGELRVCVDLAAEGMALAERVDDPGMRMEALFMSGTTLFYRAEFAAARDCCRQTLADYDDRERTRFWTAYSGHNAGVTHRCYLALALWHLGHADQALALVRETCELARTIGHAFSLGHAVDFAAFLAMCAGEGAGLEKAAEEEISIAAEQGFQLWQALGTLHKGAGLLAQGRHAEALPLLLKGFAAFRATGAEVRVPAYLSILGDAYTKTGRFDEAHRALDDGLMVAEKNDDRSHEAELHRLQGELVLAESPEEATLAEECFRRSLETARRQGSKAWELRAAISLARLRQRQGRRDEARSVLASVYKTFQEGFATPDLSAAAELLKSLN